MYIPSPRSLLMSITLRGRSESDYLSGMRVCPFNPPIHIGMISNTTIPGS